MGNVLGIVTGIGMGELGDDPLIVHVRRELTRALPSYASSLACGPPLIYADQAWSIIKKKDSTGFSMDVCAVLILSNLMRCVFWLG